MNGRELLYVSLASKIDEDYVCKHLLAAFKDSIVWLNTHVLVFASVDAEVFLVEPEGHAHLLHVGDGEGLVVDGHLDSRGVGVEAHVHLLGRRTVDSIDCHAEVFFQIG